MKRRLRLSDLGALLVSVLHIILMFMVIVTFSCLGAILLWPGSIVVITVMTWVLIGCSAYFVALLSCILIAVVQDTINRWKQ